MLVRTQYHFVQPQINQKGKGKEEGHFRYSRLFLCRVSSETGSNNLIGRSMDSYRDERE
jgi:hypothetical protein